MNKEQFLRKRDYNPKWYNCSYEQYVKWAIEKDKQKLYRKILTISHITVLIIGILIGIAIVR